MRLRHDARYVAAAIAVEAGLILCVVLHLPRTGESNRVKD
jgi:hypothetical protein